MKWSEKAWEAITPVYQGIQSLPFIQELMKGTLDKEKFAFYIQQDALYLLDYGKALTGLATRLTKTEHIEAFIGFAGDYKKKEKAMHEMFRTELDVEKTHKASPTCLLYTSYLYSQFNVPTEVMAAAVLPCFWIYMEVGAFILKNQNKDNNPFQAWIDTYVGEEFEKSVEKAIQVCDDLAGKCTKEQQNAMTEAFVMCSKMEWMFWDSAYRLEQWRV
jgi:thiaminase/transcriptional activator TenA